MTPPHPTAQFTNGNFEGHEGRDCNDHRTVGPHRAWCYECTQWCYPRIDQACRGCELGIYRRAHDFYARQLHEALTVAGQPPPPQGWNEMLAEVAARSNRAG